MGTFEICRYIRKNSLKYPIQITTSYFGVAESELRSHMKKEYSTEQLDLQEKQLEIARKKIELKKEKRNLSQSIEQAQLQLEQQRLALGKIAELRYLLSDMVVDDNNTILGSEQKFVPTITGVNREIVTVKLMTLIKSI